ncbi:MAG: nucleotidyltransferase domain-containing protein [Methanomassiliicoccales archaeon]|nr:nucleotidyltransferase domain-containing protein [Methanomassiliicoccales archaeon]
MLERLLTSKARVKLLTLFLMNPERGFHIREVARLTELNINAVRRELANLEAIGLLTSKPAANTKVYSVDQKMPILQELTSIILKTEGVTRMLKENLAEIGYIESAFVYGSFAKNEAKLTSDVDLFIIGSVDEEKLIGVIHMAEEQTSREINYVAFTQEEFEERRRKEDPFVTNVLREPKIMLIGSAP